jgi:predicted HicB family RNase H-like nuclease
MMTYKGYHARVEYDPDDEIFFGRVFGIRDGISFHADDARRSTITSTIARRSARARKNPTRAN